MSRLRQLSGPEYDALLAEARRHLAAIAEQRCPSCGSTNLKEGAFHRPDGDRTVYCGDCNAVCYQGRLFKSRPRPEKGEGT